MSKTISLSVKKQNTTPTVRKVTMTASRAAISYIMAFAEFSVPLMSDFLHCRERSHGDYGSDCKLFYSASYV